MKRALPFALAALAGVLYFEGFIGHGHYALSWVCLVPALWSIRGVTPRRALGIGAFFGWVTHLGGYPWLVHLLQEFAGLPWAVAALGYALVCAYQGFQLAVFLCLARLVADRTGRPLGLVAPVVFTAVEWLYPLLFPSYLANAQLPFPLVTQVADLGGPLLVGFVIALVNGALYEVLAAAVEKRPLPRALPAAALAVFVATLGYGAWAMRHWEAKEAAAPKLRIGLAQSNVGAADNHLKWDEGWRRNQRLTRLLAQEGAQLVVWSEGGYMGWLPSTVKRLPGFSGAEVAVLAGTSRFDDRAGRREEFNGSVLVDKDGAVLGGYDKIDLLAFGEYLPLGETFPILYDWQKRVAGFSSHFTRGRSTVPLALGPWRLATFICFEDILTSRVRSIAKGAPHVLVNLTNDSWYGHETEQEIHLGLAAFRSIEERRWMARATNTGISAFVDAEGRIVEQSGLFVEAALLHDVPMLEGGTVYLVLGDWPGPLCALLAGAAVWLAWRRQRVASTL